MLASLLSALTLVTACTGGSDTASPPRPEPAPSGTGVDRVYPRDVGREQEVVAWQVARVSQDGRRLYIPLTAGGATDPGDPCWTGFGLSAAESATSVTVTVRRLSSPTSGDQDVACAAVGRPVIRDIALTQPLNDRELLDASDGGTRPTFPARLVRVPKFLPTGYGRTTEFGSPGPDGKPEWTWRYRADDQQAILQVTVRPGAASQHASDGWFLVREVDIGQWPGRLMQEVSLPDYRGVFWQERDAAVAVLTLPIPADGEPISDEDLLQVARSTSGGQPPPG